MLKETFLLLGLFGKLVFQDIIPEKDLEFFLMTYISNVDRYKIGCRVDLF
jgi:hypothetical protein